MPLPGSFGDYKKKVTDDPGALAAQTLAIDGMTVGFLPGEAFVSWHTDNYATSSQVRYGVYPNMDQVSPEIDVAVPTYEHTVLLRGLTSGLTYLYQVMGRLPGGKDGMGNVVMNGYEFTAQSSFVAQ